MKCYQFIILYIIFLFLGGHRIIAQLPTKPPEQKPPLSRILFIFDASQSLTTTIQIPPAGLVTFLMIAPGYGSINLRKNGKDLKWVYNLGSTTKSESLTLQAGGYAIVYRALNAKQALYTINKTFEIQNGSSKVSELN